MSKVNYCPNCGAKTTEDGMTACPRCGQDVSSWPFQPVSKPAKKGGQSDDDWATQHVANPPTPNKYTDEKLPND